MTTALAAASLLAGGACGSSSEDDDAQDDAADAPSDDDDDDDDDAAESGTGGDPFSGPEAMGCVDDVSAGHHVYDCQGIVWDAEVPAQCHDAPCGLILDVHGYSMSGPMEDANTDLQEQGREHGYVVLQPTAPGQIADWVPEEHDDLVHETLVLAIEAFDVDRGRVHMTGFSQGGFMTWRFTCDHPELFASVAPGAAAHGCSSGGNPGCLLDAADPAVQVDILYLHGTADALVEFECFEPQVESVRSAYLMGEAETLVDEDAYRRARYVNEEGTVFETLVHDYVAENQIIDGHCCPGSDDLEGGLPGQIMPFGCLPPNDFDWGDEVMEFFMTHAD